MGKGCKGCGEGPIRVTGSGLGPSGEHSHGDHLHAHVDDYDDHGHEHGENPHGHVEEEPVYIVPTELRSEYVYAVKKGDDWSVEAMLCSTDIRFTLTVPDDLVRDAMAHLEYVARRLRALKVHYAVLAAERKGEVVE